MKNVLFVCSRNRLRSPTAERVFQEWPGIDVDSAGLATDAENPLTPELVEWSDLIFVMTKTHLTRLKQVYRPQLKHARVICLNIPDEFEFMDPQLVLILQDKVSPHLPRGDGRAPMGPA